MARPIRNTPILTGADADRFLHEISVLPSEEERKKEQIKALFPHSKHRKDYPAVSTVEAGRADYT